MMKNNIKIVLFFLVFLAVVLLGLKKNTKENSHLAKSKLHQYFKQAQVNNGSVVNNKQLIMDSLYQIKQTSAKINFVEVSQFTDSLSLRWITESNISYSSFVKFNTKKSKHIGTTYLIVPKEHKFVNPDLKNILSAIEFSLLNKSTLKVKDAIGDYLTKDFQACNLFYINGGESVNVISSNLGNSKYEFDTKQANNNSLYIAQYLLENYSFRKFQKLWRSGFSNFEEVYGFSFKNMTKEQEKLALVASENRTSVNWEGFNRCM